MTVLNPNFIEYQYLVNEKEENVQLWMIGSDGSTSNCTTSYFVGNVLSNNMRFSSPWISCTQ